MYVLQISEYNDVIVYTLFDWLEEVRDHRLVANSMCDHGDET